MAMTQGGWHPDLSIVSGLLCPSPDRRVWGPPCPLLPAANSRWDLVGPNRGLTADSAAVKQAWLGPMVFSGM